MTVLRESIGQPTGGRFASHRRDEPAGELLTSEDPYDYFDFAADAAAAEKSTDALTGRANGWFVEVSKTEVVAGRRGAGLTHKTDIHKFNAGWKVGFRWSPTAPPKSVVALAIKLSARLL